jgi:uncharacterized protein YccT (UPF0319 family)
MDQLIKISGQFYSDGCNDQMQQLLVRVPIKSITNPPDKKTLRSEPVKISWKTVQNVTRLQDEELKISAQI